MATSNTIISTTFNKLIDMMTRTQGMTDLERERYITDINNELNRTDNPLTTIIVNGNDYSAREICKWHQWDHRLTLPIFPTFTFTPNTYFYVPELHIFLMRTDNAFIELPLYQRVINEHSKVFEEPAVNEDDIETDCEDSDDDYDYDSDDDEL